MELIDIVNKINEINKRLEASIKIVEQRSKDKATSIAEYRKQIAITILKIKNKTITEWEGQEINVTAASSIEKIANGICWKEKLKADEAENMYKAAITNVSSLQSMLNGYQSINRHFSKL